MFLIFKEAYRTVCKTAAKLIGSACSFGKSIKIGAFCIISALSIIMSLGFVGATLALRVSYNGKTIATIRSREQFDAAAKQVTVAVNSSSADVAQVVKKPVFTSVLALSSNLDTNQDVAQAIIENTEDIVTADALFIDGEFAACTDESDIESEINKLLTRYENGQTSASSEFMQSVSIKSGYYLSSQLKSIEEVSALIEAVPIKTTVLAVTDTAIPYSTEKRNNASLEKGTTNVISEGQEGIKRTGESVTLINGEETERIAINEEVISEPVTRVIEVGTKRRAASGTTGSTVTVSGFIFPLPKGVWQVSAYFGDGRGHRAIDLRAPKGTPIYAVASGTVVKAGWDGDYGYAVVIDHGNGLQTRYAHECELYVSAGQKVSAGQEIGAVGKTGNASGNHLHFEILLNGTRIDPAPSLGLS